MKKLLTLFTLFLLYSSTLLAQSEKPIIEIDNKSEKMATYKEFGGFILDLNQALSNPALIPNMNLMPTKMDPVINWIDRLNLNLGNTTYGIHQPSIFHSNSSWGYGYGINRGWNSSDAPLNSASFKLNDNVRLNTYGDYDAQGYKRRNPSALPWEKNDFRGAFELKSNNGFSIRFEVQRKGSPYGPW